jgi:hypothetical protein
MNRILLKILKMVGMIVAILGATLLVVFIVTSAEGYLDDKQKIQTAERKKETAACKASLDCWANRETVIALMLCKQNIVRFANYDIRWTAERFGEVLPKYKWADRDNGIVRYFGDSVQLQNGFGAWQNYLYSCDFDPSTQKLVDVRAEPGKL